MPYTHTFSTHSGLCAGDTPRPHPEMAGQPSAGRPRGAMPAGAGPTPAGRRACHAPTSDPWDALPVRQKAVRGASWGTAGACWGTATVPAVPAVTVSMLQVVGHFQRRRQLTAGMRCRPAPGCRMAQLVCDWSAGGKWLWRRLRRRSLALCQVQVCGFAPRRRLIPRMQRHASARMSWGASERCRLRSKKSRPC